MEKLKLRKSKFLLLLGLCVLFGCSSPQSMSSKFYEEYLGVNILPDKKVFFYKEESAQDEGFSYEIVKYKIDGKLVLKKNYPIKDEYKQKWNVSEWKETPVINDTDFDIIFRYSLENKEIKAKINNVKNILYNKGNYYCYYYKKSSDYVEAISLYVIDDKTKTLHIFNIDT